MKKVCTFLLLLPMLALHALAAAKYKPAFYDRAMTAIHTPVAGEVEQAPIPQVNLALAPSAYSTGRNWYDTPKEQRKAVIGTVLLILGSIFLVTGLYLYFRYNKSEYTWDETDELFWSATGQIFAAASTAMLIPGFILRMKYGGGNRSQRRY